MGRSGSEWFQRFKRRAVTGESERLVFLIEQEEDWVRKRKKRRDGEGRQKRGEDSERGKGVT